MPGPVRLKHVGQLRGTIGSTVTQRGGVASNDDSGVVIIEVTAMLADIIRRFREKKIKKLEAENRDLEDRLKAAEDQLDAAEDRLEMAKEENGGLKSGGWKNGTRR